ncbi:MAG: hypothetical protein KAJ92_05125 [Gammaproteobacteria bacterium]|nr:hypothetical protein [Gammaproteobacteria bacterium]MCK5263044.1 hypothetical protein [Gammaproteobacteria bacterium]
MQDDDEIIMSGAPLDVPSDNYDEFDQELDSAKLGEKLVQENKLKGTLREYQIYVPNYLLLSFIEKKNAEPKKYRVNLAYLSSEPEHLKVVKLGWLYGAMASAILTVIFMLLAIYELLTLEFNFIAGSIGLTITLICALIFMYLQRDEYIFKSKFGNVNLFFLDNARPDQNKFDNFFIHLQQAIDKQHSNISVADRLVGELKMCRRLRDEGILDNEAYTIARTTLFKHKQYKA